MQFRKSEKGFTLLELMVVTALIGILSTVATAQYLKFRNKSRQVEAKLALAHTYNLEIAEMLESDRYTRCLRQIGFEPTGTKRYYSVGYEGMLNYHPPPNPDFIVCNFGILTPQMDINDSDVVFSATHVGSGGTFPINDDFSGANADSTSFVAKAIGGLSENGLDIWAIDQDKILINEQSGL